jgi:peptide/nickel transport system ATP-binding protein
MYLGKVMEKGTVDEIFGGVTHPYTEALLSAVRSIDPDKRPRQRIRLEGEMPSPIEVPRGCRFASRCPRKVGPICDREPPPVRHLSETHEIHCHIEAEALGSRAPVLLDAGSSAA